MLPRRGGHVAVGQRHDLRPRGRAGRVQDQRDVVGPARPGCAPRRLPCAASVNAPASSRGRSSITAMPSLCATSIAGPLAPGLDDQRLGAEVGEIELELLGAIGGIERRGDRPARRRSETPSPFPGRSAARCATRSPRPIAETVERRDGAADLRAQGGIGERVPVGRLDAGLASRPADTSLATVVGAVMRTSRSRVL